MLQCRKCKSIFDKSEVTSEEMLHDELDGYHSEIWFYWHCPDCGSEDIEQLSSCPICETEFVHIVDENGNNKYGICYDCIDKFKELYEYAAKRFPDIKFDYLLDCELTDALKGERNGK